MTPSCDDCWSRAKQSDDPIATYRRLLGEHEDNQSVLQHNGVRVFQSDCLALLRTLPDNSMHAVVTDPPYGLADHKPAAVITALTAWANGDREQVPDGRGFMNRSWDAFVPPPAVWDECLRVLKPGGHMLVFAGTRTVDLMGLSIRLAGFEIRDSITWLYGCLDDQTEILVDGRWERWDNAKEGRHALCYDLERDEFTWQPIQRVVSFPYSDTAYRLVGDHTDQLVTRDHRCIIERGGSFVFEQAEEAARQRQARVPVLEDLQGLLDALPVPYAGASGAELDLHEDVCECSRGQQQSGTSEHDGESTPILSDLWRAVSSVADETTWQSSPRVLAEVSGRPGCRPTPGACAERALRVDGYVHGVLPVEDGRGPESRLEGRRDHLQSEGQLQGSPVCAGARVGAADGPQGRLCHGASAVRGAGDRTTANASRDGAPRGSRSVEQPAEQSGPVQDEPRPQAVRASRFATTDLVRIEPVQYDGIAWCVTVPTGAFVARRNGKVFLTGNSGFPKSLDVSKAIDKTAGASREVVGERRKLDSYGSAAGNTVYGGGPDHERVQLITAPATDAARQWSGWGTALKPASEPIIVARKPLSGTVAANVLAHGCGGINVDACRVGDEVRVNAPAGNKAGGSSLNMSVVGMPQDAEARQTAGRWPTNVVLTHGLECGRDRCDDGCPIVELDAQSGISKDGIAVQRNRSGEKLASVYGKFQTTTDDQGYGDSGGASRFFPVFRYQAKAPTKERPKVSLPSCDCEDAWPTTSRPRATDETATSEANSSTSRSGNGSTDDLSLPGSRSTTRTTTSSTTDLTISNSSTPSLTSGSTPDANSATESGGSRALSAVISSPSPQTTGTSPDRDGRSTDGAVRATSSAWSTTSVCGSCGASSRSVSHATVKPLGLMRWLVRLVTLPGGTVLDPFAGSGTTGQAAALEGFPCVLVEFEPEHIPLIVKRLTGLNPEPVPSEVAS